MNHQNTRYELIDNINLLDALNIPPKERNELKMELVYLWKSTADDSPWIWNSTSESNPNELEKQAVRTLIKLSEEGISNEWCGEHTVFNEIQSKKQHKYNLRKRA